MGRVARQPVRRCRHRDARLRRNQLGITGTEIGSGAGTPGCRRVGGGGGWRRRPGRRGNRLGRPARGGGGRRAAGADFHQRQQNALLDLVADLHLELAHHAGNRGGNVHGRLVGFQCHQRILGLDLVADLDQQLDDRHVLEIADVGHPDFDHGGSGGGWPGCGRSRCGNGSCDRGAAGGRCGCGSLGGIDQSHHRAFRHLVSDLQLQRGDHTRYR